MQENTQKHMAYSNWVLQVSTFWLVENLIGSLCIVDQRKGTHLRNIQNTGRWHYSALGSRRGSYILVGSYVLLIYVSLPDCQLLIVYYSNSFYTHCSYLDNSHLVGTEISPLLSPETPLCQFDITSLDWKKN